MAAEDAVVAFPPTVKLRCLPALVQATSLLQQERDCTCMASLPFRNNLVVLSMNTWHSLIGQGGET